MNDTADGKPHEELEILGCKAALFEVQDVSGKEYRGGGASPATLLVPYQAFVDRLENLHRQAEQTGYTHDQEFRTVYMPRRSVNRDGQSLGLARPESTDTMP